MRLMKGENTVDEGTLARADCEANLASEGGHQFGEKTNDEDALVVDQRPLISHAALPMALPIRDLALSLRPPLLVDSDVPPAAFSSHALTLGVTGHDHPY